MPLLGWSLTRVPAGQRLRLFVLCWVLRQGRSIIGSPPETSFLAAFGSGRLLCSRITSHRRSPTPMRWLPVFRPHFRYPGPRGPTSPPHASCFCTAGKTSWPTAGLPSCKSKQGASNNRSTMHSINLLNDCLVEVSARTLRATSFAVLDVAFAAVRRHVAANEPPPPIVDRLIQTAYLAVINEERDDRANPRAGHRP